MYCDCPHYQWYADRYIYCESHSFNVGTANHHHRLVSGRAQPRFCSLFTKDTSGENVPGERFGDRARSYLWWQYYYWVPASRRQPIELFRGTTAFKQPRFPVYLLPQRYGATKSCYPRCNSQSYTGSDPDLYRRQRQHECRFFVTRE